MISEYSVSEKIDIMVLLTLRIKLLMGTKANSFDNMEMFEHFISWNQWKFDRKQSY